MCVQTSQGNVEEGLCGSLLKFTGSDQQLDQLRRELSSFSHRYRNLLNGMKMCFYLVKRDTKVALPSLWAEVEARYRGIEHLLEQLQSIYRPMPLTLVRAPLRSLMQDRRMTWLKWFDEAGGRLEILPPAEETPGQFDPACLTAGLDALVRWRAATAPPGRRARLAWATHNESLSISWDEHSSPPPAGKAGPPPTPAAPHGELPATPSSLVLPMLARVMTAHHGGMEWRTVPELEIRLTWPLHCEQARSA